MYTLDILSEKKSKEKNYATRKSGYFDDADKDKIPASEALYLRNQLSSMADEGYGTVACVETKNPTATVLLSIFLGHLGVDRFYIGDIGLGLLKVFLGPIMLIVCAIMASFVSNMNVASLDGLVQWFSIIAIIQAVSVIVLALWWFIDCFCSYKKAKKKNLENLLDTIQPYIYAQPQRKSSWY